VLELAARAGGGDPAALAAISSAGTALGVAVSALVNLLDVDTVVLGGFHARLAPWLTGPVEAELARRVLAAAWQPVRVLTSPLAGEAAVRGAATSMVRAVIDDPALHLASAAR
jgi:predicted NBD/HSP70 family sugar kinase